MEIGGYQVVRELGRGGMGVVYEAVDPRTQRRVALKTVAFQGAQIPQRGLERLQREAQALTRLAHPGLVPCHGSGVGPQGFFLAMGLVDGTSLDELLQRSGPLPLGRALQLMGDVGEALSYVHTQGLLHRDVKPANVLLSTSGRAVLTDFGLVKLDPELHAASQASLTRSGAMLGTPGYWPPEQAFGNLERVSAASDVYGWAATLYALLSGRAPREGSTAVEQAEAFARPVPSLRRQRPEVPGWLDKLLQRCLATEPSERPPLTEALRALRDFGGASERKPLRGVLIGGLLGIALLGLAVLGVLILGDDGESAQAAADPHPAGEREQPPGAGQPKVKDPSETGDPSKTDGSGETGDPSRASRDVRQLSQLIDSGRYTEAYRYALDWLAREPDSSLAALAVAEGCALTGRFAEGLERSEALLQRIPTLSTVWGVHAACLVAMGRHEEALVAGERSYQLDPRDTYGLPSYARALHLSGRNERALEVYDELVAYEPTALFHAQRAMARDRLDDFPGALQDVATSLALDPQNAEALLVRGHVKLAHRDDPSGVADLERALQRGTLDRPARVLTDLGPRYVERGRAEELLALLERSFAGSRAEPVLEWRVAALLELNRGPEALADAGQLLRARRRPLYAIHYGRALAQSGRTSEALDQFEAVYTTVDPGEGILARDAAREAARLALSGRAPQRAAQALRRWVELDPENLDALGMRLLYWNDQKRDALVIAEVERLSARVEAGGNLNLRYMLRLVHGEALSRSGDRVAGAREITRALELRPSRRAYLSRAAMLGDLGDLAGSARDLEAALEQSSTDLGSWAELMRLRRELGQLQPAADAAERVLQLRPSPEQASAARAVLAEAAR